jgi:poly(A) polymerase
MPREHRLTGQEAFNRLFWDARLNRDAFTVGYSDRVAEGGVREVPLTRWDPKGSVPSHRMLYIRCGTEVVWSREESVDRLASDDLPAAAWLARPAEGASGLRPRAVYRHQGEHWEVAAETTRSEVASFRLVTWNTLCDFADAGVPPLDVRLPMLREELARAAADVVALQEATPALARGLLATPRAEPVFLSEAPHLAGLDPHGPLLLSRLPFSLAEHAAGHRPVPVGTWEFAHGTVHVANVHLPSNRTADAAPHRRRLLAGLLADLEPLSGDVLVVGDFNLTGDELADLIRAAGYRDVWDLLHPGEDGSTFDPPNNPLARHSSRTGRAVRFDRVLWRPAPHGFAPVSLERFATSPPGSCFASDHYGLCSVWRPGAGRPPLAELAPVHRSALVLIPPAEAWPRIQAIRERHDRHQGRWMPHINLLYGFIPEQHFAEAARHLAQALADLPPFDVVLEDVRTFTHRRSCTAWLRPVADPPGALHALQARLQRLFPRCTEQSQHSPEGFTPHLSIGQFADARQARESLPTWQPLRWRVDRVTLIARDEEGPFRPLFEVPLGGSFEAMLQRLRPEATGDCRAVLQRLESLVAGITGQSGAVHLAGSWRLGVAGPDSDVDAICLHPPTLARLDFFRRMHEGLLAEGADELCLAADARMPKLSFRLGGHRLDVLAAATSLPQLPPRAAPADFADAESWQAARACVEADVLLEAADRALPRATFRQVLRAVRAWADARQVHGNAWGFPGGFAWAVLTAWGALQGGRAPAAFLAHLFRALTHHPWPQPAALTAEGQRYQPRGPRDRLPIIRPAEPFENVAYNVTRSTERILRAEWGRAARLMEAEALDQLFAPVDLREESERFLVLSLTGDAAARADLAGQVEGRIVGLMIDLERQLHLHVRPWPGVYRQAATSRIVIGLPALRPPEEAALRERVGDFVEGLEDPGRVKWGRDVCDRASDLLPVRFP